MWSDRRSLVNCAEEKIEINADVTPMMKENIITRWRLNFVPVGQQLQQILFNSYFNLFVWFQHKTRHAPLGVEHSGFICGANLARDASTLGVPWYQR